MQQIPPPHYDNPSILRFIWRLGIFWSLAIAVGALATINMVQKSTQNTALAVARANATRSEALHHWASSRGRIYIPVDQHTTPDPLLAHIPERDIQTPSGIALTLISPARMLSQLSSEFVSLYNESSHFHSLKPLNPANTPDAWELAALQAFENGAEEAIEFSEMDGVPVLRLMEPLRASQECLACHANQGYHIGDIQGGISLILPLDQLLAAAKRTQLSVLVALSSLWGLGIAGLLLTGGRLKRLNQGRESAENALRESEARFRLLFENAPLSYQSLDSQGNFLQVNRTWERTTGYRREEVLGSSFTELIAPAYKNKQRAQLQAFLRDGEIKDVIFELVRKDGKLFTASYSGRVSYDAENNPILTHCMFEDVTAKVKAQRRLQEYAHIVNVVDEMIALIGKDYTYQLVNQAYAKTHQRSPEEIHGNHVRQMIGDERFEKMIKPRLDRCFAGELLRFQEWFEVPAGRMRYIDVAYYPYSGNEGRVSAALLSIRDITELKEVEQALDASQKSLARAQETARLGSWQWDLERDVGSWSQNLYRIFSLDESVQPSAAALLERVVPEDKARVEQALSLARLRQIPQHIEYRIRTPDGEICTLEAINTLVHDETGKAIRMEGTVQDISARKKLEDQLRHTLQEREVLLREVHHRVKNNLTVIISLLALQSEKIQDKATLQALADSQARIRAIARLHTKLYQSPNLESIDTADYLGELVRQLWSTYSKGEPAVALHIDIESFGMSLDSAMPLGLLFNELVSNALKHAFPPGQQPSEGNELAVWVRLHRRGEQIELQVADNGAGLPPEIDPRKSNTLGLKLVDMFVQQLEGELRIESQPGTIFNITFPLQRPQP